jgi:hypothetical protein
LNAHTRISVPSALVKKGNEDQLDIPAEAQLGRIAPCEPCLDTDLVAELDQTDRKRLEGVGVSRMLDRLQRGQAN